MQYPDVLYRIFDQLAADQDARSLIACAKTSGTMHDVLYAYPSRYLNTQWMWAYQLTQNKDQQAEFKRELLNTLLNETDISPIIQDTWAMIRFLNMTGESANMSRCLDELVPDNTKTGNDRTYEAGDEDHEYAVICAIVRWLYKYAYADLGDVAGALKDKHPILTNEIWQRLEEELDYFYYSLLEYTADTQPDPQAFEDNWDVAYEHYDLFSVYNDPSSKITLFLNKIKTTYQMLAATV